MCGRTTWRRGLAAAAFVDSSRGLRLNNLYGYKLPIFEDATAR
jgi:hypothetical protein